MPECKLDLQDFHVRRSCDGKVSVVDTIAQLTGLRFEDARLQYMKLRRRGVAPDCERCVLPPRSGGTEVANSAKPVAVASAEEMYQIVRALDEDGTFQQLGLNLEWSDPCQTPRTAGRPRAE